jgi:phosphoglycerol transferase MdoB-like AlkP superfamily enzyme
MRIWRSRRNCNINPRTTFLYYAQLALSVLFSAAVILQLRNITALHPAAPLLLVVAAVCLSFRIRRCLALASFVMFAYALLILMDWVKRTLTTMPLTATDLYMFGSHPFSSLDALMIPFVLQMIIISVLTILLGMLIFYMVWELILQPPQALVVTLVIAAATLQYADYIQLVRHRFIQSGLVWTPLGLGQVSREVTLPVFLLFSSWLQSNDPGIIFDQSVSGAEPLLTDGNLVRPTIAQKPNIIALLVESTFDPNLIFRLSEPFQSSLFQANEITHAVGPLYVNAVGGGTWISEFEFLTGLDTRFFGYRGYYSHASISHLLNQTFPRYLRDQGYRVEAYYGTDASFFNARKAFINYGFERLYEKADLGIEAQGWKATDVEIADAVIGSAARAPDAPFFKFALTLENHSPHDCRNFHKQTDLEARLAGDAPFDYNCQLNEYLRRLRSTERAVAKLLAFLRSVETETGRPFVLLLFGDHQPHTFTRTGGAWLDFRPYRNVDDPRVTFFHVMSSAKPSIVWNAGEIVPLTLLPTLLSAYVAPDVRSLYLPVNIWAFRQCGHDMLGRSPSKGFVDRGDLQQYSDSNDPDKGRQACGAIGQIVAAYRRSNVLRSTPIP